MSKMLRLLVAEDEIELRTVLRKTLTHEGFEVETASNGREALELLQRDVQAYDLLITDLRMPEKDGEQLLEEAHLLNPDLKVIVISGFSDIDAHMALRKKGASDYVIKPFKIPDLLDAIERAFAVA